MELQTAIEILEYHQEWRLGKREDMIHEPKKLTQALDIVLSEVKKAVEILERHNNWRRGDDSINMENPTKLGKAIDIVVKEMKNRHIVDFSEIEYPYAIKPNNDKCVHPLSELRFHSDSTVSCKLCGMRFVVF